mmetsp:Transcript_47073/g.75639  ORF Transcript_47073/g.75639 Transcript_47073/m.75639 type:complete len:81 (+) Transcript_47073:409-651(+)
MAMTVGLTMCVIVTSMAYYVPTCIAFFKYNSIAHPTVHCGHVRTTMIGIITMTTMKTYDDDDGNDNDNNDANEIHMQRDK